MFNYINRSFVLIKTNLNPISMRLSSSAFENMPIFKSGLSLDKLYSKTESPVVDTKPKTKTVDKFDGHIPIDKLDISYSRSSGPGGQHVNTTDTKVTVKLHLSSADWIPEETKQRLAVLHKNNINKDGFWVVRSDKTRAQLINLGDCMDKIRCYITEASKPLYKPSVETLEMLRERREKASAKRLQTKRERSMVKRDRHSD